MTTPNLYTKTAAPLATNDGTQGYVIGDIWEDTTHKQTYYCLQTTTNNAIWAAYPAIAQFSIVKTGPSVTDNGHFALVNDIGSPGNSRFYGTSPTGTKGWQYLPLSPITIGGPSNGFTTPALVGIDNSGAIVQIGNVENVAANNIVFGSPGNNGYVSICDGDSCSAARFYDDPATPLWPVIVCNSYVGYALQCNDVIHQALFCNCPAGSTTGGAAAQFSDPLSGVAICDESVAIQAGYSDINVAICDYTGGYGMSAINANINVYLCDLTDKVGLISGVNGAGYIAAALSNTYFVGYIGGEDYAAYFLDSINSVVVCNDNAALTIFGQTVLPTLTANPTNNVLVPVGIDGTGVVNLAVNAITQVGDVTTTSSTFKNALAISLPPNETWILDFNLTCSSTSSSGILLQLAGGLGLGTTTLTANVVTTDTTINVANGAHFAVGSVITIDSEEMAILSIASNVLTVLRAVNGTTVDNHTSGNLVFIGGGGLGQTVLSANVLTTDVTITVADGTQFINTAVITVDSEQMQITSKVGNVLTVVRGYNGTTIATHTATAVVFVGTVTLFCNGNTSSNSAFQSSVLKGAQNPTCAYCIGFNGIVNIKAIVRTGNQAGPVILQFASLANGQLSTIYDSSYVTATPTF